MDNDNGMVRWLFHGEGMKHENEVGRKTVRVDGRKGCKRMMMRCTCVQGMDINNIINHYIHIHDIPPLLDKKYMSK